MYVTWQGHTVNYNCIMFIFNLASSIFGAPFTGAIVANAKTLIFFYKQPVYKQLALWRQIAKWFSGIDPFSLSKSEAFPSK